MQSQLLKRMHAHPIHRNAQAVVPRGRIFEIPSRRTLPRLLSSASPSPVKNSTTGSFDGADFYPANDTNECGDDEVCLAEKEIIMESVRSMDVDGGQAELAVENVLYDTSTVSKAIKLLHELHGTSLSSNQRISVALAPLPIDLAHVILQCPHGNVKGIMRSQEAGVLTCSPSDTLEGIIPKLNKVTGMPVISEAGKVIGVISRKVSMLREDSLSLRKAYRERLGAVSLTSLSCYKIAGHH